MNTKKILIIAGPNGAGKSTFASDYLSKKPEFVAFVNADVIAAKLSPSNPELAAFKAGRLMLEEIAELVKSGSSFAIETTLSGRSYLSMIKEWRLEGYRVKLVFLSLPSPEDAIDRVAARVTQGGHHVPDEVVRRRFTSGLNNFRDFYRREVDSWCWYDSSDYKPKLIDAGDNL